jgi:hypothetical protein
MKRASNVSDLFERSTQWLAWWQELILNWVATWNAISILQVSSSTTDDYLEWDVPSDLELARMERDDLLDAEPGKR